MKKIIDGKRYDTDTATSITFIEYGTPGDFRHRLEELFKTKKGNFFLSYNGGALSKYATNEGPNLVRGSSGIQPLTVEEALTWCETNNIDGSIIEKHFDVDDA